MARQRNVYDTDRVAHLWYHRTQESARNRLGNFYFDGDTIYSYGRHFPIAQLIVVRGETVVLFTNRGYSVTTSKHISLVRRAIPHGTKIFYCHSPGYQSTDEILQGKRTTIDRLHNELKTAKNITQRCIKWSELRSAIIEAREFARFFRLKGAFPFPRNWKELDAAVAERNAAQSERNRIQDEKRREKWKNWQELNKEAAEKRRAKEEADRLEWEAKREQHIATWRQTGNGDYSRLQSLPCMLRISGDEIETSHGAIFPISHARRVLPIVKRILDSGESWQSNGHTIHLGHYSIERIEADGTIIAGCHRIPKEETLRLIAELESAPAPVNNESEVTV